MESNTKSTSIPGPWDLRPCPGCKKGFVPGTRRSCLCAKCDPSAPRAREDAGFHRELRGGLKGAGALRDMRGAVPTIERRDWGDDAIALAFERGGYIAGWERKREGDTFRFTHKDGRTFTRPVAAKKAA